MNSFHKLATKNDFSAYLTQINCHFFFLQGFAREQTQDSSVRDIFRSRFLGGFVSKRHISFLIK